jgi:hypothetical protein
MKPLLLRFGLALILGATVGLTYGWLIQPVEYVDTAPSSLREDYRTDYVLMVAEAYSQERDIDLALRRIAALGPQPPLQIVHQALTFAMQHDFHPSDVQRLNRLGVDIESATAAPQIEGP